MERAMKRKNLLTSAWCPAVVVVAALIVLVPCEAESSHSQTCPGFGGTQWALVSIVDDEGFALHDDNPVRDKLPPEIHLMVAGTDAPEAAPVLLCMETDSWASGVASCGFPLMGVSP